MSQCVGDVGAAHPKGTGLSVTDQKPRYAHAIRYPCEWPAGRFALDQELGAAFDVTTDNQDVATKRRCSGTRSRRTQLK